jgi:hypothetical protein
MYITMQHENTTILFRGYLDKVKLYQYFLYINIYCVYVDQWICASTSPSKCVPKLTFVYKSFSSLSTTGAVVHDELWPLLGSLATGLDLLTFVFNF